MSLSLITFDLDDTLWDNRQVLAAAEQAAWGCLALQAPEVARAWSLEAMRGLRLRLMQAQPTLAHRVSWLRRESVRQAAQAVGVPPVEAERLAEEVFSAFISVRSAVQPFPGALDVLVALRERYMVAALTNGNTDLYRAGLAGYFDFWLTAEDPEVDAAKPARALFDAALARAGCREAQALHVGDAPEYDILGARLAGWHALWFNPTGEPWPRQDVLPTAEVRDWQGLSAAVEALAGSVSC